MPKELKLELRFYFVMINMNFKRKHLVRLTEWLENIEEDNYFK